ncbi:SCP2 domain-containing protein [Halioxenophilus sp. WMMB6]|uniref:ubiquinone biosynthesis accessory factor UbiJ n=1 Tax=Halioxenophilus sp. WMMB6 TaxID=3073815 RepID=UPI00295E4EF7|nr:hypothetical protein [Halioxenophilus sp. WMMB6]
MEPGRFPGPTATSALLAAAEQALNQALRFDPGSRERLAKLEGQSLLICLREPEWQLGVTVREQQLVLLAVVEEATTELQARAADLLAWLVDGKQSLAELNIEVTGSTQLLIEWQALAQNLDIDWEDGLNRWLGDLLGHGLAELVRSGWSWARARQASIGNQLMEFLLEEKNLLPNRALFDDFRARNQSLRLHTDRLEARLRRLRQKLAADDA